MSRRKYVLEAELGRGGQGVVYRARRRADGSEVAIKVLHDPISTGTSCSDKVFTIRHPGVCPVHEVVQDESRSSWVVMDLLAGETLQVHLRRARGSRTASAGSDILPANAGARSRAAARIVEHLARAMHAIHEKGMLHGDIKPSNVLISPDGRPVLMDVALFSERSQARTTPAYAAPEQLSSTPRSDASTDVYGLGLILLEMATLRHPFRAPTEEGTTRAVTRGDASGTTQIERAGVPTGLSAVIEKSLEISPKSRYRSALALAEDLERLRKGDRPRARRPGPVRRAARFVRCHRRVACGLAAILVASALLCLLIVRSSQAAQGRRMANERYADSLLLPALVREEGEKLWRVLPDGLSSIRAWLRSAEGVAERARVRADEISTEQRAQLAELGGAVVRMRARERDAASLRARTLEQYADAWLEATAASAAHLGGLVLPAQIGLVPLGPDPNSGLLEFAHLQSGELPRRDAETGHIVVAPGDGIVFVLVPGGVSRMGLESGVSVELDPYLVSKYELTLGQWRRLGGARIGGKVPRAGEGEAHPARRISWEMATRLLGRYGLTLPTEAQWEHAARAGVRTPWITGSQPCSLGAHANLADRSHVRGHDLRRSSDGRPSVLECSEVDDGFSHTAPVGSLLPNAFGLHDVHGNVIELVRDAFGPMSLPARAGDGERVGGNPHLRLTRGGAWSHGPSQARLDARAEVPPDFRSYQGCRPARSIDW